MKKLLLSLILLASAQPLAGMETQKQLDLLVDQPQCTKLASSKIKSFPMTAAKTYHYLSHDLLIPEIAQQIFLLQLELSGVDFKKLSQSCEDTESLVRYIKTLIDSCGYPLASGLCEWFFAHTEVLLCTLKDGNNNTPLYYAIKHKYQKVAKILIQIAGDNAWTLLTMQDIYDQTALHWAARNEKTEGVKLILDAAGDNAWTLIAMQNTIGSTALHWAGHNNRTENAKLILDAAGDNAWTLITMKNDQGKTAFDLFPLKASMIFWEKYIEDLYFFQENNISESDTESEEDCLDSTQPNTTCV